MVIALYIARGEFLFDKFNLVFDVGSATLRVSVNAHVAANHRFNNHSGLLVFDARNLAIKG